VADSSGASASEILKSLKEGDKVRALILSIDREKKRISFGLKPSYFFEEELQDEPMEDEDEERSEESEGELADGSIHDHQMAEQHTEDSEGDEEVSIMGVRSPAFHAFS
jgi:rRNA biogenesis protein RRP5